MAICSHGNGVFNSSWTFNKGRFGYRECPQLRSLTFLGRKRDILGNIDHTDLYATRNGSTIG